MHTSHLLLPLLAAAVAHGLVAQDGDKPASGIPADTEIKTTASGLKYSVLKAGKPGTNPEVGQKVFVHYTGWLTDGTKFDSSRDRGEQFSFTVGRGVIKGWSEGLQLMTVGSRFKFTIPADLGYGPSGRGKIPANATLIFDVELFSVVVMPKFKKADPAKQKEHPSGFKYEPLKEGEGEPLKKTQVFKMGYAIWRADGTLLDCSEQRGPIPGTIDAMALEFLKQAPLLLSKGARFRFEVPQKIGIPQVPGTTVWELEMLEILEPLPVPEFSLSPADKKKKTASGLEYEVIKEGTGKSPAATDTVEVHYAGWLTDGTLFDSSFGRAETTSFPLNRVISGWTEGIQLMKEGATYKFTIPGNLAYGPQGSPPKIGPDATLVFYVELIKVK